MFFGRRFHKLGFPFAKLFEVWAGDKNPMSNTLGLIAKL